MILGKRFSLAGKLSARAFLEILNLTNARNAIIITLGFLPLTISTLSPYVTVGVFFASLMLFSTLGTLIMLPSALRFIGSRAIPRT